MSRSVIYHPSFGSAIKELNYAFSISGDTNRYRYGFNGQEKDNEINGEGNVYTAEFWEYDGRLGRRWNIDLMTKIDISNYIVFHDNPILLNDPNGDDDIFDANGNFIKHEGTGHDIYIRSATTSTACFKLSSMDFDVEANQKVYAKIATYYIKQLGVDYNNPILFKPTTKDAAAFTILTQIYVTAKDGKLSESMDNFNILSNTLIHEYYHVHYERKKELLTYEQHACVYIMQANHSTFEYTPTWYKVGILETTMDYAKASTKNLSTEGSNGISDLAKWVEETLKPVYEKSGIKVSDITALSYKITYKDDDGNEQTEIKVFSPLTSPE